MGQKLCIVTDAWIPQVNGVVTTLINIVKQAELDGWEVLVIHPGMFYNISAPRYPEVKLSLPIGVKQKIKNFNPDHLHIATEGPLGLSARISFRRKSYTTAYHTRWAPFLKDILGFPEKITWKFIRWFHQHGKVMVPTSSIKQELLDQHISSMIVLFGRGVDLEVLKPSVKHKKNTKPRILNVGRISYEKNLEDFCKLNPDLYDLVLVGNGPQLLELRKKYPHINFKGLLKGEKLANEYTLADAMVFPSKKDTFGVVIIESQCLGTPVAAYPVPGPIDVILPSTGVVNENLELAIQQALQLDRDLCQKTARKHYSWNKSWQDFKSHLVDHQLDL